MLFFNSTKRVIIRKITILFLCLFHFSAWSQDTITKKKGRYRTFLKDSDQSYVRMAGIGMSYKFMPFDQNFKAIGLSGQYHLNLARFFSRKLIFGVTLEVRGGKGFVHKRFSDDFKTSMSNGLLPQYASQKDSALAYDLVRAVNGSKYCRGNYMSSIGIIFSPFPYKWGGLTFLLSRGQQNFPVFVASQYYETDSDDWEYVMLNKTKVISGELRIHPALFFKQQPLGLGKFHQYCYFSLYYEQANTNHIKFKDVALDQLLTSSALDQAFKKHSFGFKLGVWLK